ncbi:MAG TPA: DMT family transporter [Gemmatimonadales bacterium]|jgi:drug/metabolite transporter (DMT)-like permease|nr:DMT family transporter [Gemmatimonadales bacterium]
MIYLLAIGSALFYGAADFTGGLATRRAGAIPVVLLSQASGLVLLALILPLLPHASPSRADLLWGAVAGLTGGIGVALLYRALAIGRMAVVAPTTAVCAVTIPVVVSVLLGERPLPLATAGIALGIVSIVLVSRHQAVAQADSDPTASRRPATGVGTAFASGVAIGFFFLSLAQTGPGAGMWPLIVARSVSVTLFGAVAIAGRRSIWMPAPVVTVVIGAGIIDMVANALYMLAARQGPLSLVVTLSSLYPASTVLLARVVLGERLNPWQISGVGCALAAIVMIVSGAR